MKGPPNTSVLKDFRGSKKTPPVWFGMTGGFWKTRDTLPKFNMEPKNDGFQKESPIPGCHFQVPC